MIELLAVAALIYALTRLSSHKTRGAGATDELIAHFDPLANRHVLPRNVAFERRLLSELSQSQVNLNGTNVDDHGQDLEKHRELAFLNNHALTLPGGQIYYTSGADVHTVRDLADTYAPSGRR